MLKRTSFSEEAKKIAPLSCQERPICVFLFFFFFSRVEDVESLTSEKKRLSQSLDHKTKKALDLETKYDVPEYCGFYF